MDQKWFVSSFFFVLCFLKFSNSFYLDSDGLLGSGSANNDIWDTKEGQFDFKQDSDWGFDKLNETQTEQPLDDGRNGSTLWLNVLTFDKLSNLTEKDKGPQNETKIIFLNTEDHLRIYENINEESEDNAQLQEGGEKNFFQLLSPEGFLSHLIPESQSKALVRSKREAEEENKKCKCRRRRRKTVVKRRRRRRRRRRYRVGQQNQPGRQRRRRRRGRGRRRGTRVRKVRRGRRRCVCKKEGDGEGKSEGGEPEIEEADGGGGEEGTVEGGDENANEGGEGGEGIEGGEGGEGGEEVGGEEGVEGEVGGGGVVEGGEEVGEGGVEGGDVGGEEGGDEGGGGGSDESDEGSDESDEGDEEGEGKGSDEESDEQGTGEEGSTSEVVASPTGSISDYPSVPPYPGAPRAVYPNGMEVPIAIIPAGSVSTGAAPTYTVLTYPTVGSLVYGKSIPQVHN